MVFVATSPVSLRQSFDGLANAARSLALDPLSGHLLVFLNRRKNHVKILVWTRGGFTIVQKRLERGTFAFAQAMKPDASTVEIDAGSTLKPPDYQKLEGPWIDGKDPAPPEEKSE